MWIITFAILTAYGALSGATDICEKGMDVCFIHDIPPMNFPQNIEELDKICPIVTNRLSCLVDYQTKCGTENNPGTVDDHLVRVNAVALDACDQDSELHQKLSVSLPCLERVIMNHGNSCQAIIREAMDAIRGRLLLETVESGNAEEAEDSKYFCLYEALDLSCLVANSGVICGSDTKELVAKVVDEIGYLDRICDADIREEVDEMVALIQLEIEEKVALKKTVSKS